MHKTSYQIALWAQIYNQPHYCFMLSRPLLCKLKISTRIPRTSVAIWFSKSLLYHGSSSCQQSKLMARSFRFETAHMSGINYWQRVRLRNGGHVVLREDCNIPPFSLPQKSYTLPRKADLCTVANRFCSLAKCKLDVIKSRIDCDTSRHYTTVITNSI